MIRYPRVFSPLRIGGIQVKNHIETAPMLSCLDNEGVATKKDVIAYYQAFAMGGVLLVVVADSAEELARGSDYSAEYIRGECHDRRKFNSKKFHGCEFSRNHSANRFEHGRRGCGGGVGRKEGFFHQ